MSWLKSSWLRVAVHIAAILPFVLLVRDFYSGTLTANPIEAVQLRTGLIALNLLVITLAGAPVYAITRYKPVLGLRRLLGLYAFGYASLHLLNFIGTDYRFDFGLLWADIGDKRYIFAGLAAFIILLALAVTSTAGWRKRLGTNWKRLHRLLYAAALLAALHFIWQTKAGFGVPLAYTGIIFMLLILRLPAMKMLLRLRAGPNHETGNPD